MNELYGLIGKPLGHSFSKKFFTEKFEKEGIDAQYLNFELDSINDLYNTLKQHPQLKGFNVTIPYKVAIIPMLDYITPEAQEIGAVNCVKIINGNLHGYNTDVIGFKHSLLHVLEDRRPKALILGTGGVAQAVKYALSKMGISYQSVSRQCSPNILSYEQLTEQIMASHKLIVNTTPLGTSPNVDSAPQIPYQYLGEDHILFDLVYNPAVTKFMSLGKQQGSAVMNGSIMLIEQALAAWDIWQHEGVMDMAKLHSQSRLFIV